MLLSRSGARYLLADAESVSKQKTWNEWAVRNGRRTHPYTALDISSIAFPIRICRLVVWKGVSCPLARLEEIIRWPIVDQLLWIVADDAIARSLILAGATGAKKGDVAACDRDARAGAGDWDAVSINV